MIHILKVIIITLAFLPLFNAEAITYNVHEIGAGKEVNGDHSWYEKDLDCFHHYLLTDEGKGLVHLYNLWSPEWQKRLEELREAAESSQFFITNGAEGDSTEVDAYNAFSNTEGDRSLYLYDPETGKCTRLSWDLWLQKWIYIGYSY